MSSRTRVTKGHSGNRRSHHALKAPRTSVCPNCGNYHQRHRVCHECGFYKGNKIINNKEPIQEITEKNKKVEKDKK